MSQNLFNELFFDVGQEIYSEVMFNPDSGFGYKINLKKKHLSPLQLATLDFLLRCHKDDLLGTITLTFNTNAVGDKKPLSRRVEKIQEQIEEFVISNSY